MPEQDRTRLAEEAADIFVRLRADPENKTIQAERDAFLGRGVQERQAWASVAKAWAGTAPGRRRGPKTPLVIAFVSVLSIAALLGAGPLRINLLADHVTREAPATVVLSSGDGAMLDGGSAILDDTGGTERRVRLLRGAVFFEVETGPIRFIVEINDATVEVIGTAFEVAEAGGVVAVAVTEGVVELKIGPEVHVLEAGDQLRWSDAEQATLDAVEPEEVAAWRSDRFAADGLTFAEVAAVIDRRLPGRVVVASSRLASSRVVGNLDLTRPRLALDTLAAARGATVLRVPWVATIVVPRR